MVRKLIKEMKYRLYEGDEDILEILNILISTGQAKDLTQALSYIVRNFSK